MEVLSDSSAKINQEINSTTTTTPSIRVWSITTFYCVNDNWGCSPVRKIVPEGVTESDADLRALPLISLTPHRTSMPRAGCISYRVIFFCFKSKSLYKIMHIMFYKLNAL